MAKVFKTLKKKAQATPLVGVILDSLKSENPRQNAPSIQAVLDNLQPKQLLMNPDFQINHRGQTTYYANGTNWLYTVDMWRINNHSKLYVNDGYIRFHKVDSNQQALLNQVVKTEGKSITVIKVRKINGTATVRFGDSTVTKTITQSGIFTIKNNTPISSVAIDLVTNGHYIDIEYIDLWEGDIAYPHVKEDKSVALLRCKNYVKLINLSMSSYDIRGENVLMPVVVNLDVDFIDKPTFVQVEAGTSINVQKIDIETFKNNIRFKVFSFANGFVRVENAVYLFSCEPLS